MIAPVLTPVTLMGSQFSTYKIGGPIQRAYMPTHLTEAIACIEAILAIRDHDPECFQLTLIGWGSNSLFASAGISGETLITRKLNFVEALGNDRFRYGAGTHLAKVAKDAELRSLSGAEFLIGIPGTVGGAVRMNAGAMGQETASVILSAHVYSLSEQQLQVWSAEQLAFHYRTSAIQPQKYCVLAADFQFQPGEQALITQKMRQNLQFRKQHHPTEPNGGSVFRNPVQGNPEKTVGFMLDQLGAKTWRQGGVCVSPVHANFIVNNTGLGTSTDVLVLMLRMKCAIKEHFGYDVYPENFFIGDATHTEKELWKELTFGNPHEAN